MFDSVICDYPLDDPEHNKHIFQTKRLACCLDYFRITKEGKLLLQIVQLKEKPEDPGFIEEPYDYTGEIVFYDFKNEAINNEECCRPNGCIEYSAYFEHGQLVRLNRIK